MLKCLHHSAVIHQPLYPEGKLPLHLLYMASATLRNSETVLFYPWLSLCHAWVWIMEWQQCESKVAARTQKWRGHVQRRSLWVACHLCWAPSCYTVVGSYLFNSMPMLWPWLTIKGRKQMSSSGKFCRYVLLLMKCYIMFVFCILSYVFKKMFCRWLSRWASESFTGFCLDYSSFLLHGEIDNLATARIY